MEQQRALFSLPENIHYLNCAYRAPLMKIAEQEGIEALKRERNPAEILTHHFFDPAKEARSHFGKLVHAADSDLVVIPSSSYGFANVIKNVPYQKGQHAITLGKEFPSGYMAAEHWCKTHDAELKVVSLQEGLLEKGKVWNEQLLESITDETALVVLSSVHWMYGIRFDLESIGKKCQEVGAFFVVDGTQSIGMVPMDVQACHIDALICSAYKWMLGPYSIGMAFMGNKFHSGVPIEEAWMNRSNSSDFTNLTTYESNYHPGAARYNMGGSSNFVLLPMLNASLQQIVSWEVDQLQAYCGELIQPLLVYFENIGCIVEPKENRGNHILGIKVPESIDKSLLLEQLKKNQIYISQREDLLRISFNVFNTKADIEVLIHTFEQSLKR